MLWGHGDVGFLTALEAAPGGEEPPARDLLVLLVSALLAVAQEEIPKMGKWTKD